MIGYFKTQDGVLSVVTCPPRVCVGFCPVLWFPPTIKDVYVRVNPSVSAPEQRTGKKRTGVGLQALQCGCPLLLVCVIHI